jgi:hypothetical protein
MQVSMRESNDLLLVSISHFSVTNKLPYANFYITRYPFWILY